MVYPFPRTGKESECQAAVWTVSYFFDRNLV